MSSESAEQSPRAGNGTKQCRVMLGTSQLLTVTVSGTDSSGNDEINNTREQRGVQLESQDSPTESFTICAWNVTGLLDKLFSYLI